MFIVHLNFSLFHFMFISTAHLFVCSVFVSQFQKTIYCVLEMLYSVVFLQIYLYSFCLCVYAFCQMKIAYYYSIKYVRLFLLFLNLFCARWFRPSQGHTNILLHFLPNFFKH